MEKTCSYDICTGCGVCAEVCPKHCISFVKGDFGHIFPKIDTAECIDCDKCRRVCPALIDNGFVKPEVALAAVAKDEAIYKSSTSGGVATVLSILTIRDGGVVYGCACTDGAGIEHIRVDSIEGLSALQGSKYVQSNLRNILKPLVADVKSGRPVLFIGTPCQCGGIKALLGKKNYDNLLLVDLVCHGVPSLDFLHRSLIRHGLDLNRVKRISFRDDNQFVLRVEYDNGEGGLLTVYKSQPMFEDKFEDLYYYAFMAGLSYRPSCYSCRFAQPERCTDITIGDFWGYGRLSPAPSLTNHPYGLSLILPVSDKGRAMTARLQDMMKLCRRPVDEAIKGNDQLRAPKFIDGEIRLFSRLRPIFGSFAACAIAETARKNLNRFREVKEMVQRLFSKPKIATKL